MLHRLRSALRDDKTRTIVDALLRNPKKPVACPRCSGSAHAHVHAGQLHVRAGPLSSVRLVSDQYRRTPRTPSRLGDAPQLFPSTRSPNSITGDSVIGMVTHKDGVNRAPRRTVRQRRCSVPVALAWTFPTPTWKPVRFGYKEAYAKRSLKKWRARTASNAVA